MADIPVQVCYAKPDGRVLRELNVAEGTTVGAAIEQSRILIEMPEIDLANWRVGIFGKLKSAETVLRARDRVEIYRPLLADPKDSRRQRAEKKDVKKAR